MIHLLLRTPPLRTEPQPVERGWSPLTLAAALLAATVVLWLLCGCTSYTPAWSLRSPDRGVPIDRAGWSSYEHRELYLDRVEREAARRGHVEPWLIELFR